MESTKIIGQTKDAGFEVGIRKTFQVSTENARDFLFSNEGIKQWLGEIIAGELTLNQEYHTKDDTEGTVKIFNPSSHIRITWKKKEWSNVSTIQIRIIPAKKGTTISFHQERMLNNLQREEMKKHWEAILKKLKEKIQQK
ncbi:MAG TPA: SRPBCC domain-containing protein [Bacteroidales bacterium]